MKKLKSLLIVSVIFILFLPVLSIKAKEKTNPKITLVLVNSINWSDIKNSGNRYLIDMASDEASGLLSNRVIKSPTNLTTSTLTVGAGSRTVASRYGGLALNAGEKLDNESARFVFERLSGIKAPNKSVVALHWPIFVKDNSTLPDVIPGLLGENLKNAGLKVAVLGNSDTGFEKFNYNRQAVFIAADKSGIVEEGDVSSKILKKDSLRPFGLATDYKKLFVEYKKLSASDLVIIDSGDTYRADLFARDIDKGRAWFFKKEAISEASAFIAQIEKEDPDRIVIVASLLPPQNEDGGSGSELTPIIIKGNGFTNGYLTSKTTNRKGLISSVDIAPTILKILGIDIEDNFRGSAIATLGQKANVGYLIKSSDSYNFMSQISKSTIVSYIVFLILIFINSIYVLLTKNKLSKTYYFLSQLSLLITITIPLAFYVIKLILPYADSVSAYRITSISLILVTSFICWRVRQKEYLPILLAAFFMVLTLTIDLLAGSWVNFNTMFGYSPIVAGRFYGIGNESMSFFIASAVLSAVLLLEYFNNKKLIFGNILIVLALLFVLFIIGLPNFGANVGGFITAAATFTTLFYYLNKGKVSKIKIVLVFGALVGLLLSFAFFDYYFLGMKTHLGRTFALVANGGIFQLYSIFAWKLAGNYRVLRNTTWTYLFIAVLIAVLSLRYFSKNEMLKNFQESYPKFTNGMMAIFIGGVCGGLVNDSGIVIPTIMWTYYFASALFLLLHKERIKIV